MSSTPPSQGSYSRKLSLRTVQFIGGRAIKGIIAYRELEPFIFEHEFFVAQEVGLKHLLTEPWTEDDHHLHQFEGFEETEETNFLCDAEELKTRFMNAHKRGWFSRLSECQTC